MISWRNAGAENRSLDTCIRSDRAAKVRFDSDCDVHERRLERLEVESDHVWVEARSALDEV
jgi:hypothetical protein